jgi:FKBP-type peptidyl-prolyl cis-trans isomerase SlyD
MRVANNCVVTIEFQLTNTAGQVVGSATAAEPLEYLHGAVGILPTLERALTGKSPGDTFDVTIPPEQGFGERQPRLVEVVPRSRWSNPEQLSVGANVERVDESGGKQSFRIRALDADTVTVDGNHPLAGETLRFAGKILDVRQATAEEIASVQQ